MHFWMILSLLSSGTWVGAQTTLVRVEMRDLETKEALLFANVLLYNELDSLVWGSDTDFDGRAEGLLPPGPYYLSAQYTGYATLRRQPIDIPNEYEFGLILELGAGEIIPMHPTYGPPGIRQDDLTQGRTFGVTDIRPNSNYYPRKRVNTERKRLLYVINGKRYLRKRNGRVVLVEE